MTNQARTFEELRKKTVYELRELAATIDHEAVKGYSQLNKDHLLKALCIALKIEMHAHHHILLGLDKKSIKLKIQSTKEKKDEAIQKADHKHIHILRRKIHHLKRKIRKVTVND